MARYRPIFLTAALAILAMVLALLVVSAASAVRITGTPRSDTLRATSRADVVRGLAGNDKLYGQAGNDKLYGQAGNDKLYGQAGNDRQYGGRGNDKLYGQAGNDKLYGQAGRDTLIGGSGKDLLVGGPAKDVFRAGPGNDTVNSRDGVKETIDCGGGKDVAIVDALDTTRNCKTVRRPATGAPPVGFAAGIQALGDLVQPTEAAPQKIADVQPPTASGDFVCSVTRYKAAPGYNEMFLMDPTSDVIYPGSILYGDTITTGEYIPLIADRAPMGISTSLENIAGSPARTVNDPKLSTVRTAINSILSSDVTGSTAARMAYTIEEVHSQNQLALSLGANYKNSVAKVAGSFDFSRDDVRSRVIAKFQQIYYTIDMDLPGSPADLFRTPPSVATLGSTSPMYVSTVTYGRMILFTAESSYAKTEIGAALQASFESGVQSGEVKLSARNINIIQNSSIKAFVLGGSGQDAAAAVVAGVDGLQNLIATGGDYSKDSPAAPLSYKLRYLKNNAIARIVLASEYNVRQCDRVKFNYKVTLKKIYWDSSSDPGDSAEAYGWIRFNLGPNPVPGGWIDLWRVSSGGAQDIPEGGFWPLLGVIREERVTIDQPQGGPPPPDRFLIEGHLSEVDDWPNLDDGLGDADIAIFRTDADTKTEPYFLSFNGDGNQARVELEIVPND